MTDDKEHTYFNDFPPPRTVQPRSTVLPLLFWAAVFGLAIGAALYQAFR